VGLVVVGDHVLSLSLSRPPCHTRSFYTLLALAYRWKGRQSIKNIYIRENALILVSFIGFF